ncbi:hypothetical protein [Faecalibacter sp. LW9]|uniref:hypothetical protein n=1 Tax=Faecalibacter sp. LW9 TaxID=3103144 RepID=UPI002AFE1969|nr:hypothetical protein [Faecalibacter sp. LW9]
MKFYRGDKSENFKIKNTLSRYNVPCLFFSKNKDLAKKYQEHFNGYLYEFDIKEPTKIINFNFQITHSSEFRNLIMSLRNQNHQSVLIKNCIDYPKEIHQMIEDDILIVFDFNTILSYQKIDF